MLETELPGRTKRRRPKRKFLDVVGEILCRTAYLVVKDMQVVVVTEDDAEDRTRWKQMIQCDDPQREKDG